RLRHALPEAEVVPWNLVLVPEYLATLLAHLIAARQLELADPLRHLSVERLLAIGGENHERVYLLLLVAFPGESPFAGRTRPHIAEREGARGHPLDIFLGEQPFQRG